MANKDIPCGEKPPNYYSNNFVKPQSILIRFGTMYLNKFAIICVFEILYKMENKEPA